MGVVVCPVGVSQGPVGRGHDLVVCVCCLSETGRVGGPGDGLGGHVVGLVGFGGGAYVEEDGLVEGVCCKFLAQRTRRIGRKERVERVEGKKLEGEGEGRGEE